MSNFSKRKSTKIKKTREVGAEAYINKQILVDLEKRISLHLGSFLVLAEEGDPSQIALAHQKARSDFIKFAPEMSKVAQKMGGDLSGFVEEFLDSIDTVLYCRNGWLDDEKISRCFRSTEKLRRQLQNCFARENR